MGASVSLRLSSSTRNDEEPCKGALNKAADEIDAITNDQYNKYFDKLIDDVLDGKNTIDPWKGIM